MISLVNQFILKLSSTFLSLRIDIFGWSTAKLFTRMHFSYQVYSAYLQHLRLRLAVIPAQGFPAILELYLSAQKTYWWTHDVSMWWLFAACIHNKHDKTKTITVIGVVKDGFTNIYADADWGSHYSPVLCRTSMGMLLKIPPFVCPNIA